MPVSTIPPTLPPPALDPLGEALHFLRMTGSFYCRSEFSAPWGLVLPPMHDCLMLHVVTAGRAWLEIDGDEPCAMEPGDLLLLPRTEGHRLVGAPGAACAGLFDLPREAVSERYEVLRHGGGGAPTTMVCAAVNFDHPAARQLVMALPRRIRIAAADVPHGDWMQATLRLMAAEARAPRPGGEAVVTRLADILVIQAIRSWIAQDEGARSGWLGALQDRQIGRAIAAIHRDPAAAWTLPRLAAEAAMSRSAFAARFTALVGVSAMQYLARWRMHLALARLQEHDEPLIRVAEHCGYRSEAAFSRAFKRCTGYTPGGVPRRAGSGVS